MKTVYSAIQPSGLLTIGNYIGALKQWPKLQEEYKCLFSVADMHAITVRQDPKELRERSRMLIAVYLACGIDPKKSIMYINSHVSEHAELAWILDTYTSIGQLKRMHQFKSKIKGNEEGANAGLFCYPVLMAADILLYNTDFVPVGDDQKQHVEITRDIAERFNSAYGDTFVMPEPLISKTGARIKSLQDPMIKMSKSDPNDNAYMLLLEDEKTLKKKLGRAVTDSVGEINYTDDQPGVKNLIDIYQAFTDESLEEILNKFEGKGYGELKNQTFEAVNTVLKPIRENTEKYLSDQSYIDQIIKEGATHAKEIASETLERVYDKVGFVRRI